jgi:hypothetical protein
VRLADALHFVMSDPRYSESSRRIIGSEEGGRER